MMGRVTEVSTHDPHGLKNSPPDCFLDALSRVRFVGFCQPNIKKEMQPFGYIKKGSLKSMIFGKGGATR